MLMGGMWWGSRLCLGFRGIGGGMIGRRGGRRVFRSQSQHRSPPSPSETSSYQAPLSAANAPSAYATKPARYDANSTFDACAVDVEARFCVRGVAGRGLGRGSQGSR